MPLLAEHMYGWHTHVLSFARYTKRELAIIAINFNDGPVDGHINLKYLGKYFPESENSDIVLEIEDWI